MKIWRLIKTHNFDGYMNMAINEALTVSCRGGNSPPVLRFYTWPSPFISIGYFQRTDWIKREGLHRKFKVVRRITGGKGVFHGNDLSYGVILPGKRDLSSKIYHTIFLAFMKGFNMLGINADPYRKKERKDKLYVHNESCFSTILGDEISVDGKKLMGSARKRWKDIFFQEGSILVTPSACVDRSTSVAVEDILGKGINIDHIISALASGFEKIFNISIKEDMLTGDEIELARKLASAKYSNPSWNWKR